MKTNSRCDNGVMVTQNMTLGDNANEVSRCLPATYFQMVQ